jgi:hypothetical protein
MCKKTTCLICGDEKFMTPCGANNDCKVYVCYRCKSDKDMIMDGSLGAMECDSYKCCICKEREWKMGIKWKLIDLVENTWGVVNEDTVEPVFENVLFETDEAKRGYTH